MPLFLVILLTAFAESLVAFAGGLFAIFNEEKVRKATHFIVSFAVGALLSVALLDLIPEAAEMSSLGTIMPWVLGGVVLFFLAEKFLFSYHCHDGECPVHTYTYLVLWGDFIHNFIDGVIIVLAFMADFNLGIVTAIAVVLHEIPQELSDFWILIHGGLSRAKALLYNFLSASSVMVGAVITYFLGTAIEPFLPVGLALVAGGFIYLAATDLLPELHESAGFYHGFLQALFIAIGALLVIAPGMILGVH